MNSQPSGASVEVTRTDQALKDSEIKNNMDEAAAEAILSKEDYEFFGPLKGTTPAAFKLKREGEYKVIVSKVGYETVEVDVTHKVAGAGAVGMAGNVILGGAVGAVVDANTGATQDLVPNPVEVILKKK